MATTQLPPPLLNPQWVQRQLYAPPRITVDPSVMQFISEVSSWRPVELSNLLVDVLDNLRDVKRLAGIQNAITQQATREALLLATTFCNIWERNPPLRVQMDCTHTKQNPHVRMFWTTAFAALALSGQIITYYEADDTGMTVHMVGGELRSSSWTTIRSFYQSLRLSEGPKQCRQKPRIGTEEATTTERHLIRGSEQNSESQPDINTIFDSISNGLDVPQELDLGQPNISYEALMNFDI